MLEKHDNVVELQEDQKTYTIGEAADILGVSVPTLRLYEIEGLVIPFRRGSKHRRYSEKDIERIQCIRNLINQEKVSIEGIKRLLALIPCWIIKQCPETTRANCAAFEQITQPCWMVTNRSLECKNVECRLCPVYTEIGDCKTLKRTIIGFTAATPVVGQTTG